MTRDLADALCRLPDLAHHERAAALLGPMEDAAHGAATPAAAHAAFVRLVRETYGPAVREAHRRSGHHVAQILDNLAQALGAGRVRKGPLGNAMFLPRPGSQAPLIDFMAALVEETLRPDPQPLPFATR